jgi:hypothetical protein
MSLAFLLLSACSANRKKGLPFGRRGGIESGLFNAPRLSSLAKEKSYAGKIVHIALKAKDLESSTKFYEEVAGFWQVTTHGGRTAGVSRAT